MAKETKYSIQDLKREFPSDEACVEYLFDAIHTRECSCGGRYSLIQGRRQLQCSKCRFQIAPQTGTIFEKSTTDLSLWFHAIFIFSNAKSGISAKELERQLGVTYKTAWRILNLIRSTLSQNSKKLKGTVEMDEAYMGGKGYGGRYNKNAKEVMAKKSSIIGAIERGGDLKIEVSPNVTAETLGKFLNKNIEPKSKLYTDESNRYNRVAKVYDRSSVNHGKFQYVKGDVHVNNIESFWGHIKRSIKGTHKVVSKKHLQAYLDGFAFHYNNRHNDRERFASLLSLLVG